MPKTIRVQIKDMSNQQSASAVKEENACEVSGGEPTRDEATTTTLHDHLCKHDFVERICLVKLDVDKLWPALQFSSAGELQAAVRKDVNVTPQALARLQNKILQHTRHFHAGVAYLLGRGKIRYSLMAVEKKMICNFYEHIGRASSDLSGNEGFKRAYDIAMSRLGSAEGDNSDTDETASLDGSSSRVSIRPVMVKEEDEDEVVDFGDNCGGEDNLINSDNSGTTDNKKDNNATKTGQITRSEVARKKRKVKSKMKTPKAKRAAVSSTVTPSSSQQFALDIEKGVAKMISPDDEPYSIITNAVALELLQSKFGLKVEAGKYYLSNQDKPVASSLANLRKDLCNNGLPDSTSALTFYEKVD